MKITQIKFCLKFFVSFLLLYLLIKNLDYDSFFNHITQANVNFIAIVFLIFLLQFFISAGKWQISLQIHRLYFKFKYLLLVCFVSFFYNNFLPTSIGGDGYRVYKTINDGKKSPSISSVLYERIIGIIVLAFLGLLSSLFLLTYEENIIAFNYVLSSLVLALVLLFLFFFARKKIKLSSPKLLYLTDNLRNIVSSPRGNIKLVVASFIFQVAAVLAFYLMFKAFGEPVDFDKCVIIAAVSSIVAVLPVSINGIGVLEGAIVITAVKMGADYDASVAVSILLRLLVVPFSFVGFIISLVNTERLR